MPTAIKTANNALVFMSCSFVLRRPGHAHHQRSWL